MLAACVCFWLKTPGNPPFKLCRSDWPGEAGSCGVSSFEHPTGWKPRLSSAGGPAFSCFIQELLEMLLPAGPLHPLTMD